VHRDLPQPVDDGEEFVMAEGAVNSPNALGDAPDRR
jgi:hypothetical protein